MLSSFLHFRPVRSLGLALFFASVPARAQENIPPLTLSVALARADERNPTLAALNYRERAAGALIEQAGFRPNPTLTVAIENVHGTGRVQGVRSSETTLQ